MASIVKPPVQPANQDVVPTTTRPLETEWLLKNSKDYKGQWVVLDGDRLISHGQTAREVFDVARALGLCAPYVIHIPSGQDLPFGGW